MARIPYRQSLLRTYLLYMICRDIEHPTDDLDETLRQIELDTMILLSMHRARYLVPRHHVPKAGNLHLAFEYAQNDADHPRFIQMLRVTPAAFQHLLALIHDHDAFTSRSNRPQAPVEMQLAVTLYRAGRFGNGASVHDVARVAGISEGTVVNFTNRCMEAILALEPRAMWKVTEVEKEREKLWVEKEVGCPPFRDGWCTGDGTLVSLCQKPGLNGDAYFSRKSRYDLNVQIINLFTNLRIVDYVTGNSGSAHDSNAFQHSAISKFPDWFFGPNEFMWADSEC